MIKIKRIAPVIPLVLLLLLSFLYFSVLKTAVAEALALCAVSLIPSLFPFLIFTELSYRMPEGKRLFLSLASPFAFFFRCSREGAAAYLYGLLFGFPLGSKILGEYYREGRIGKAEAERLLLFCNNTGPAFLVGAVGIGFLGSARAGLFLYLLEILVSFLFGAASGIGKKVINKPAKEYSTDFSFSFPKIMQKSVTQMLSICGYVVFFSALTSLLSPFLPNGILRGFFYSLFEVGTASAYLSTVFTGWTLHALLSFCVCFSGVSVYMQALDLIADTGLSGNYYIPAKLLQGACAFFAVFLLSFFFG